MVLDIDFKNCQTVWIVMEGSIVVVKDWLRQMALVILGSFVQFVLSNQILLMLAKVEASAPLGTIARGKQRHPSSVLLAHSIMKLMQQSHPSVHPVHLDISARVMATHILMDCVIKDGIVREVLMLVDLFLKLIRFSTTLTTLHVPYIP